MPVVVADYRCEIRRSWVMAGLLREKGSTKLEQRLLRMTENERKHWGQLSGMAPYRAESHTFIDAGHHCSQSSVGNPYCKFLEGIPEIRNRMAMEQHETEELSNSGSYREKKPAVRRVLIQIGVLLALALVSIFVMAKMAVSPEFVRPMEEALDSQQSAAMAMAGSASGLSFVLAAVPTDATTPVANQLANLSSFFVISIAAVILQKALITVVGYVSFTYLIPLACGLGITYLVFRWESVRIIAVKLAFLAWS